MFSLADTIQAAFPFQLPIWLTSYHQEVTPLSTWPQVSLAIVIYLSTIFGLREIMRDRPPMKLTFLFQVRVVHSRRGVLLSVRIFRLTDHFFHICFVSPIGYRARLQRHLAPPSTLSLDIDFRTRSSCCDDATRRRCHLVNTPIQHDLLSRSDHRLTTSS